MMTSGAVAQYFSGPGYGQHQMSQFHIPQSHYQAPIVDHYVGQPPKIWDDQQPVERFLTAVAKRSWVRTEYLHWNMQAPGGGAIGADVTGVTTDTIPVFDNLNGGIATGEAIIPTTEPLSLNDAQGIRGTLGVALNGGSLEMSFFGTNRIADSFSLTGLQDGRAAGDEAIGTESFPNVVVPLTTSGAVTDFTTMNAFVYDDSFAARIESRLWGSDIILLTDPVVPGEGFQWQWLGGFRYANFREMFYHSGHFDGGGTGTPRTTRIGGTANNNIYGPQVGARASLVHRKFTFSVTPRIAFALNDQTSRVTTGPLTDTLLDVVRTTDSSIEFTPVVQLEFKGEIHVNQYLSLFGGYDFLWLANVSRPDNNIVYNSEPGLGGGFDPDITQDVDLKSFYTRGFSLGAVFRY
jgi:hypothetical protein